MPPRAPVIGAVIRRELRQARARSVTVPVSPPEIVGGSSDHRMTAKGLPFALSAGPLDMARYGRTRILSPRCPARISPHVQPSPGRSTTDLHRNGFLRRST